MNINRNSDHPDAEKLPYPTNRVLGLVTSEEAAWRVVDKLKAEGFAEGDMELFTGEAGQSRLHSVHSSSGALGFLNRLFSSLPEQEESKQYEEGLKRGWVLIAVKASDDGTVERVKDLLAREDARLLRYYGRWAIRRLA